MKSNWRAKSFVANGDGLGNLWVCVCNKKRCVKVLALSEEPTGCKENDNVFRGDPCPA